MGASASLSPLIKDVDCPPGSEYIDSYAYAPGEDNSIIMRDVACVFETRNSIPLRRHVSQSGDMRSWRYAFGMPDSSLVVRHILSIHSHDYIIDYELHQNGAIEVKVTSAGYVSMVNNLNANEVKHGYMIDPEWGGGGSIYQCLFNLRLDVDVAGVNNRFKTMSMRPEAVSTKHAGGRAWYQMAMDETLIGTENAAMMHTAMDTDYFIQYNFFESAHQTYESGLPRGYRVLLNGASRATLPDASPLLRGAASWMKYPLAVTKYKDDERLSTAGFTQGDPFNPLIGFDQIINDNDTLIDADLVVWATVGLQHIPTYEDLPAVTTTGNTVSVSLIPFNFFKRDPSIHSRDVAILTQGSQPDYPSANFSCPSIKFMPDINV